MQLTLSVQVLLILIVIKISCSAANNCFLGHDGYKCRLGSRTPYRFIANHDDSPVEYPGCVAKKIWLIFRHGTRYPGKKYVPGLIEELPKLRNIILENYKNNKTTLTDEEGRLLSQWNPAFTSDDAMKLAEEGEHEMIDLGERYQSRFPSLMPQIYDNQTYKFKYTDTQRTKESARHFAAGLFGWHNSQHVWYPEPEQKDPILRFYKRCRRWNNDINKNPDAQIEKERFLGTDISTKTLVDISQRIGHNVNYTSARLMYLMCAFETAWNKSSDSPWCNLFSSNDFKVLEYAEDLEYYWIDGYGYKLTYEQACPALRDMFSFLSSSKGPRVSAYFTHSGTILKLLALVGVAKDDEDLKHDLFLLHNNREWRTGIIDAFGTNMAFVLYDCATGGPSVLFMHQERPVYLSGCPLNAPCPLSIMKALYPDQEQECQFDSMCKVPE